GHIHLHVAQLPEVEEFYTKGLGFEVVTRYGNQAIFISDAKYHHHIALNTWNGVGAPNPASNSVGLKHYTITLPNETKRGEIIERLNHMNMKVKEQDGEYFTQDPSGNRIKLEI